MVIDARDRFIHRMAETIRVNRETDTPSQMQDRFARHTPLDKAKASVIAAKASAKK